MLEGATKETEARIMSDLKVNLLRSPRYQGADYSELKYVLELILYFPKAARQALREITHGDACERANESESELQTEAEIESAFKPNTFDGVFLFQIQTFERNFEKNLRENI